jgi:hypothetical protein
MNGSVKMVRFTLNLRKRRLAWPTLVVVLAVGCSSGLDNRQGSDMGSEQEAKLGQSKMKFRTPEMAEKYKTARSSPRSFDPVYGYAKADRFVSLFVSNLTFIAL